MEHLNASIIWPCELAVVGNMPIAASRFRVFHSSLAKGFWWAIHRSINPCMERSSFFGIFLAWARERLSLCTMCLIKLHNEGSHFLGMVQKGCLSFLNQEHVCWRYVILIWSPPPPPSNKAIYSCTLLDCLSRMAGCLQFPVALLNLNATFDQQPHELRLFSVTWLSMLIIQ